MTENWAEEYAFSEKFYFPEPNENEIINKIEVEFYAEHSVEISKMNVILGCADTSMNIVLFATQTTNPGQKVGTSS